MKKKYQNQFCIYFSNEDIELMIDSGLLDRYGRGRHDISFNLWVRECCRFVLLEDTNSKILVRRRLAARLAEVETELELLRARLGELNNTNI